MYNHGLLPNNTLRLDFGEGYKYDAIELGDGTGYIRIDYDLMAKILGNWPIYHKFLKDHELGQYSTKGD